MNSKTIFIGLTILVLLALSVQSIRLGDSHRFRYHKTKAFVSELAHRIAYYHLQEELPPGIPANVPMELI